jgi:hypothetical protein
MDLNQENNKYACRVCGLIQGEPPWGDDDDSPNFSFCACCGCEFGYHDCNIEAARNHRKKWGENGTQWKEKEWQPIEWSPEHEMKNIPLEFL